MLITRSVLVQMGSMIARMKGIDGGFKIIYAFLKMYCHFIFIAGLFLVNDMQTSSQTTLLSKPAKLGFLVKKDVQCYKTYVKTIFRFLVF